MRTDAVDSMELADDNQDTNTQPGSGGTTKTSTDREVPVEPEPD